MLTNWHLRCNCSAALEFERRKQKVAAILLHPGTVDTDLSKPFQKVSKRLHTLWCCNVLRCGELP